MVGRISFAIIESFLIDLEGWLGGDIYTCRFITVPIFSVQLVFQSKGTFDQPCAFIGSGTHTLMKEFDDDEDVEQRSRREFHGGEDRI